MRQKKLFLCFLMITSCMFAKANAQTVEVLALNDISTVKPAQNVSVKLLNTLKLSDEQIFVSDVIFKGEITDVKQPKILKRDATFSFVPKSYIAADGSTHQLNSYIKAKYAKQLDKKSLAKSAVLGAGGFVVKGLSTEVAAVSGVIKNEQGNRIESGLVSAFEASPFSYVKKGSELHIQEGQVFYLKFPEDKKNKKNNSK